MPSLRDFKPKLGPFGSVRVARRMTLPRKCHRLKFAYVELRAAGCILICADNHVKNNDGTLLNTREYLISRLYGCTGDKIGLTSR
eukprot:scaffold144353_cov40-Prasinocladus_malaysianus.AAC.1